MSPLSSWFATCFLMMISLCFPEDDEIYSSSFFPSGPVTVVRLLRQYFSLRDHGNVLRVVGVGFTASQIRLGTRKASGVFLLWYGKVLWVVDQCNTRVQTERNVVAFLC